MATYVNPIVTTIGSNVVRKSDYRGNMQQIPIFIDASAALINNADVITLTSVLPQNCKAVAIALNHDGANGVAASTTLAVTAGGTVLTPTATIPTSADTNSTLIEYSLKNTDVSGLSIIGTVGGADWADTVDLYGYITIVTDE
jgi:hypothetical protein|tara:strand:+ start:2044 stop:2472 length:429 start_codon:yes stop_codon:yes gene_type:complete